MADQSGAGDLESDRAVIGFDQAAPVADGQIEVGQAGRAFARTEHQRVEASKAELAIAIRPVEARFDQRDPADLGHAEAVPQRHDGVGEIMG